MRKVRSGWTQRTILYLEPSRRAKTIGSFVMLLIFGAVVVGALTFRTGSWTQAWRDDGLDPPPESTMQIVAAVAAALALICALSMLFNAVRWRRFRMVRKASEDPRYGALMPMTSDDHAPTERAPIIPPLQVDFTKPSRLPKPRGLHQVEPSANVVSRRPLDIVYLRLFENQPRMRTFVQSAWREFGYVHLLRSAASVTHSEMKEAKRAGGFGSLFVKNHEQFRDQLASHPTAPNRKGRYTFKRIGPTTIRVRDPHGSYPVRAVLCHGTFWKDAIDTLLAGADLVVIDLSGYSEKNQATRWEMQRVVDRVAIERVVFLRDQRSKTKFLEHELQVVWSQMAAGSPNATAQPRTAVVAVTDAYRANTQQQGAGGQQQVQVKLVANRRQSRRLAAAMQGRVDDYDAVQHAAA